jgi:predicted Holliday junction resolvase-like endonuclease
MTTKNIIEELKKSNLYAECTSCGEEFKLSSSILFDGLGAFPSEAEKIRQELLQELKSELEKLKKRKISAVEGAEKKAIEVGIGKIIEKILPTCKDFNMTLSDCRPLFEPIDMIVFNGATNNRVNSITFLEIKTGNARLNEHQRMIRDAIVDKKVSFRVI